jgi:hypothetical protein
MKYDVFHVNNALLEKARSSRQYIKRGLLERQTYNGSATTDESKPLELIVVSIDIEELR